MQHFIGYVVLSLVLNHVVLAADGWVYDEITGEKYWLEEDKDFVVPKETDRVWNSNKNGRMFHQITDVKDLKHNMIHQIIYDSDDELHDSGNRKMIPQPDHNIDELYSDPGWSACKRKCDGSHQLCSSSVKNPFEKWRCNMARVQCRKSCHSAPHYW